MARLYPLFSGSEGNSYFLGSKEAGILIDAGKNAKQIGLKLDLCGISPNVIKGILITHEHSDHISALRVFATKYNIPTFCTDTTAHFLINEKVANGSFPLHIIPQNLQIADMEIEHFVIPHDSMSNIGFRIKTADDKVFSFATDIGQITDVVRNYMTGSDFCVIESNHDVAMLQSGPYPYNLKRRVMSNVGHLSNEDCAMFVKELCKNGTKRFMLAHLSRENNTPELAFQTSVCALTMGGFKENVDFVLDVAKRENLDGKAVIF